MTEVNTDYILQPHRALNCIYQQYRQLGEAKYAGESAPFSQLVKQLSAEFATQYHQAVATRQQQIKLCVYRHRQGGAQKSFYLQADIQSCFESETVAGQEKLIVQLPIFSAHTRKEHRQLLATYVGMLHDSGYQLASYAQIILATGRVASYACAELLNTYRDFKNTLQNNLAAYCQNPQPNLDFSPQSCGKCSLCKREQKRLDDLYLLPGVGPELRQALHAHGIYKVRQLALQGARLFQELPGDKARSYVQLDSENILSQDLLQQARRQTAQNDRGLDSHQVPAITAQLQWWQQILQELPASNQGDIYIDFESNPFWDWSYTDHKGLVYLAGIVSKIPFPKTGLNSAGLDEEKPLLSESNPLAAPSYRQANLIQYSQVGELSQAFGRYYSSWTATDYPSEKQLFTSLIETLSQHLTNYPRAHIYHYSEQEKVYLRRLAHRHQVGTEELEETIIPRMIDLLPVVRKSVIISQGSKTLKDIEAIYMGKYFRQGSVTDGADSVAVFDQWNRIETNLLPEKLVIPDNDRQLLPESAPKETWLLTNKKPALGNRKQPLPAELELYNEYDCVSTLMLHQWICQEYAKSPRSRGLKSPREI